VRIAARLALGLLGLALLVAAAIGALRTRGDGAAPPSEATGGAAGARPHVVVIVLDTTRADFLDPWRARDDGLPAELTPRLDALARDATVFERAFVPAPWTVPSHASLFTGLHPIAHGASFLHHRWLDDRFTTLAEALRDAGYRTISIAANRLLESTNLLQGFEVRAAAGERFRGLALRRVLELVGLPAKWMDQGAADAVEAAERALPRRESADAQPVFLFVNLLEPHWRHFPPLADRLALLPPEIGWLEANRISARYYGPLVMAGKTVEGPLRETMRALYAASIRYQDRQLGRLVDAVDARLDPARTLLVVTADHGENLGEGGRWDHVFALNDALIRVPLLVRQPGRFAAGRRESGLCETVDVTATIAEAVGGLPLRLDPGARSLAPERFTPRERIVAEGDPYYGHLEAMSLYTGLQRDVGRFARLLRAVRDDRHKLVWAQGAGSTLHDLAADPDEVKDVSAEAPDAAARLQADLDAWLAERAPDAYRPEAGDAGGGGLSDAERERLRSLGYLR
jgi:arylsulfatase A-like enzyme